VIDEAAAWNVGAALVAPEEARPLMSYKTHRITGGIYVPDRTEKVKITVPALEYLGNGVNERVYDDMQKDLDERKTWHGQWRLDGEVELPGGVGILKFYKRDKASASKCGYDWVMEQTGPEPRFVAIPTVELKDELAEMLVREEKIRQDAG
jgi:hypothetical protein